MEKIPKIALGTFQRLSESFLFANICAPGNPSARLQPAANAEVQVDGLNFSQFAARADAH